MAKNSTYGKDVELFIARRQQAPEVHLWGGLEWAFCGSQFNPPIELQSLKKINKSINGKSLIFFKNHEV